MRTIHLDPLESGKKLVKLSDACECDAVTLIFDVSRYENGLPGCSYELMLKNPAGVVYRRRLECSAGTVTYHVQDSDTAMHGQGEMQLLAHGAAGEKVLSARWTTIIDRSLLEEEPADPPDPYQSYAEMLRGYKADAEKATRESVEAAEASAKSTEAADKAKTGAETSAQAAVTQANRAQDEAEDAEESASAAEASRKAAEAAMNKSAAQAARAEKEAAEAQRSAERVVGAAGIVENLAKSIQDKLDNGDFDGADGVSPIVTVEETATGHTVTVEDATGKKSFDVRDGADAPQINDSAAMTTAPWSGAAIVTRTATAFTTTGNPVQCWPMGGSALTVTASNPVLQCGKNLALPDAIGQVTYIKTDASTTKRYGIKLPGGVTYTCSAQAVESVAVEYIYAYIVDAGDVTQGLINYILSTSGATTRTITVHDGQSLIVFNGKAAATQESTMQLFADAQLQVEIGDTATAYDAPHGAVHASDALDAVTALDGVNTLYTADGAITVSGAESPRHTLEEHESRIADLEEAVVDGGGDVDLSNYVQKTDYAATNNAGVVKVYGSNGITLDGNKRLTIQQAIKTEIDNRSSNPKAIVPSNLDYAVKVSITTNTIPLTAEEQQNAQSWLGIELPRMNADLAADDDSTAIPNTKWVNAAIEAALTARGL